MTDTTVEVSSTLVANLDNAPGDIRTYVTKAAKRIAAFNDIALSNSASSRTVSEIANALAENSTDANVVKIREQIASLQEKITSHFTAEAEKVKAETGEPDILAEKKAAKGVSDILSLLEEECEDNGLSLDDVRHFLPDVLSSKTKRNVTGGNVGPKQDLKAVREWARANGFDVGDKGRISDDVLDAYSKRDDAA